MIRAQETPSRPTQAAATRKIANGSPVLLHEPAFWSRISFGRFFLPCFDENEGYPLPSQIFAQKTFGPWVLSVRETITDTTFIQGYAHGAAHRKKNTSQCEQ
jgi:hypothetical protein